jgi:hypothetical protein
MNGYEEINKKINNFIFETFSHISIQKALAIEDISKNKLMNKFQNILLKKPFYMPLICPHQQ